MKTAKGTKEAQVPDPAGRTLIPADVLRDFCGRVFRKCGVSADDARVAADQIRMTLELRRVSTPEMRDRFAGVMQTVWTDAEDFLDQYFGRTEPDTSRGNPIECCRRYLEELKRLAATP